MQSLKVLPPSCALSGSLTSESDSSDFLNSFDNDLTEENEGLELATAFGDLSGDLSNLSSNLSGDLSKPLSDDLSRDLSKDLISVSGCSDPLMHEVDRSDGRPHRKTQKIAKLEHSDRKTLATEVDRSVTVGNGYSDGRTLRAETGTNVKVGCSDQKVSSESASLKDPQSRTTYLSDILQGVQLARVVPLTEMIESYAKVKAIEAKLKKMNYVNNLMHRIVMRVMIP